MQNKTIKKSYRIEWVDIGKAICIFFILVTHLEARTNTLYSFYSPIYLSGFFFLSGYTYKEKDSFKEMFLGKVKILLWPWLLYSLLNIFASAVITLHSDFSLLSSLKNLFLQIRGEGDGLWFLAALFVAYMPFYFVIKLHRPRFAVVISCVLSAVSVIYCEFFPSELLPWGTTSLPWHIEYMFQAMLWMVLGYYFKNARAGFFEDMLDKHKNILTCVISLAVYTIIAYIPCGGGTASNIIISYVRTLIGIGTLAFVSKSVKPNRFMRFMGRNTLLYYALHGKVKDLIQVILRVLCGNIYTSILASEVFSSIFALIFALFLSVILIIPIMLINRFLPWTLGRKCNTKNR